MDDAAPTHKYRRLDPQRIIDTVVALQERIQSRFPGSSLGQVVAELRRVAEETVSRTEWIQRPHLPLRLSMALLTLSVVAMLLNLVRHLHRFQYDDYLSWIQALEATISSVVFIGAAGLFLLSWENRIKRARALKAVHELRAMAHIVDMHQLTKDPETGAGQRRSMTPFLLSRYLDYCCDSLALLSKIAALYVQEFQDPVLLAAVDEVESLTSGFARKIWQKITIIDTLGKNPEPHPAPPPPEALPAEP